MTISPLDDILAVERELAGKVDSERTKAGRRLEETRGQIDESMQAELARLREEAARDEQAAEQAAAARAKEIVERAQSLSDRLAHLDEARLRDLVWKSMASTILPGATP
jgi:hypothetical protein